MDVILHLWVATWINSINWFNWMFAKHWNVLNFSIFKRKENIFLEKNLLLENIWKRSFDIFLIITSYITVIDTLPFSVFIDFVSWCLFLVYFPIIFRYLLIQCDCGGCSTHKHILLLPLCISRWWARVFGYVLTLTFCVSLKITEFLLNIWDFKVKSLFNWCFKNRK